MTPADRLATLLDEMLTADIEHTTANRAAWLLPRLESLRVVSPTDHPQKDELQEAYDGWRRTLEGVPQKNGEYAHLLICSGDRRQPPGTRGISCCCRPSGNWTPNVAVSSGAEREAPDVLQLFVQFVGEGHVDFPRTLSELSEAVTLFEAAEEDLGANRSRPHE